MCEKVIDVTGLSEEKARALLTPEMIEEGERTMERLRAVLDSLEDDTGQTANSSMLKPCPFCEGRAWLQYWGYPSSWDHGMQARVVCSGCHVSTSRVFHSRTTHLLTGEDITKPLVLLDAIKSWNRRANDE